MTTPLQQLSTALGNHYRVERELGQGGMATVYLAVDLKHHRKVAIKVLRPELAAVVGADRFLREIQTIASLQHPHILGLIDSGEVGGTAYYVMPYVEGESLRDRLARETQLSISDAVRIATEVASALDYAHRHGVIHRDIKPENILLHDGQALVADFGIALAVSNAGGTRMTETGMSLGTPHYMSPEQAMGERDITPRSDIYSLGCVLYEMLLGEPPFTGPTAQAIVARVMTEKPASLMIRRETVTPPVEQAVLTALAKLPADRWPSAVEFARALSLPALVTQGYHLAAPAQRATRSSIRYGVTAALVVGAFLLGRGRSQSRVTTGKIINVTAEEGLETQPAISPDGQVVAYVAGNSIRGRIYLRPVSGGRAVPLTSDTASVEQKPRWSPGGTSILYLAGDGVDTVGAKLGGGTPATIISGTEWPVASADWSPDGRQVVFVRHGTVMIYTIATGETRFVDSLVGKDCRWSPRGDLIACSTPRDYSLLGRSMGNAGPSQLVVVPVAGGHHVPITDDITLNVDPVWAPDGRRLYFVSNRHHQRDIYYVDLGRNHQPVGEPVRLTTALNAAAISLSRDGRRLAYAVYVPRANIWSLPILPNAVATSRQATQVTFGHQLMESLFLTPDGRTLFYDSDRNGSFDIWRITIGDSVPELMAADSVDEFGPRLSPDGTRLAFYSYREGSGHGVVMVKPMDGGPIEQVNSGSNYGTWPVWNGDANHLQWSCTSGMISRNATNTRRTLSDLAGRDLCAATRLGPGRWQIEAPQPGSAAMFTSPDGRWWIQKVWGYGQGTDSLWISAVGDSTNRRLLYARRTTADPYVEPQLEFSPDSRIIYFKSHDDEGRARFWALPVSGGPPRLVAQLDDPNFPSYRPDFATDGRRFYFAVNDRQSDIAVVELLEP